jgi:hypothetical protein
MNDATQRMHRSFDTERTEDQSEDTKMFSVDSVDIRTLCDLDSE